MIRLQKFHFSLNPHKSQLFRGSVAVVKEQLLSWLDVSLGKNTNPVISVHHQNFCTTVGIYRVVGESDFVSLPGGVNHVFIVEVEEKAAHVLVVHLPSSVCLVLRDDLPAVLGYELVLVGKV